MMILVESEDAGTGTVPVPYQYDDSLGSILAQCLLTSPLTRRRPELCNEPQSANLFQT